MVEGYLSIEALILNISSLLRLQGWNSNTRTGD